MFMEHRCGDRISTDIPVRLVALPGTIGPGRIVNVSMTGAYVETQLKLPLLSLVALEPVKRTHRDGAVARLEAYVVRLDEAGIGIEWGEPILDPVSRLLSVERETMLSSGVLAQTVSCCEPAPALKEVP
jgi:hypothetical protein